MSGLDREDDRPDELTARYRAAAAADPSRPSEAVRQSILAHASALASHRAARNVAPLRSGKPAASALHWRMSVAASVIVAAFATVLALRTHVSPTSSVRQERTPAPARELEQGGAGKLASATAPAEPDLIEQPATLPRVVNGSVTVPRQRTGAAADLARRAPAAAGELSLKSEAAANSARSPASVAAAQAADSASASASAEERSVHARSAAASPPPAVAHLTPPQTDIAAFAPGNEMARSIDWAAVGVRSPIPRSMPTASSDDPLAAGFSPEWARRALQGWNALAASRNLQPEGMPVRAEALALAIMSKKRASDDQWAHEMERRLRAVIRTEVDSRGPTVSRVFCNGVGCLCYTERDAGDASAAGFAAVFDPLISQAGWARELAVDPRAVYVITTDGSADMGGKAAWQLVFVMRSVPPQN